ncbi:IpaD/SipD/SspD family type III secretion system needle tip protein [Salmonella enterica subsp. enterica serovar Weltevreden]|nr:IpaD/SipD/SspD family type III secretion system needle tip protein [Salmonella enterica subsp. enterica serovar Weltevreden]
MVQDGWFSAPGKDSKLKWITPNTASGSRVLKAQEENMKTTLQTRRKIYSNANSLYDNRVKS